MGVDSLLYSFVARGTVVLAEYTAFPSNCSVIAIQCLERIPTSNSKITYTSDRYSFHFLGDDGFTYLVVADEDFGREIPFAYLDRVKEDFQRLYGGAERGRVDTATAQSLNREFGPKLKQYMTFCVEHPEEVSRLSQIQTQESGVTNVKMENIDTLVDRGEQIEVVVHRADNNPDQADEIQGWRFRKLRSAGILRYIFLVLFFIAFVTITVFVLKARNKL